MREFRSRVAKQPAKSGQKPGGFAQTKTATSVSPLDYSRDMEASRLDRLDIQDVLKDAGNELITLDTNLAALGNVATRALGHWRIVNGRVITIQASNAFAKSVGFTILVEFATPMPDTTYSIQITDHQDGLSTYYSAARNTSNCQIAAVRTVDTTAINLAVGTYEFAMAVQVVI